MTAENKANELGNKFYQGSVFDYDKEGHLKELVRAKERAKICVQEILEHSGTVNNYSVDFWYDVIEEIDKL
jgi:hypothetical protein